MRRPARSLKAVLLVLVMLVPASGVALAQGRGMQTDLERELERTEDLIREAADLAREAGNAQAGELLRRATELQMQARGAYSRGYYDMCRMRTNAARQLAQRAMSMLLDPDERADRIEHELRRTDETLARAREELGPGGSTPDSFLEAALRQQQQAWELFRAGQMRPAVRMTFQVRDMLRKYGAQNRDVTPDDLRARFERVEDLMRRATDAVREGSDPRALQWVERAEEKLRQADELMQEGHARGASRQLDQAHKLTQRAIRQAGRNPDVEEFQTAARRYEEQVRQTARRIEGTPNSVAAQLLGESEEHYQLARELAMAGEESMQRAMAELHLAFRLLNRAGELLR